MGEHNQEPEQERTNLKVEVKRVMWGGEPRVHVWLGRGYWAWEIAAKRPRTAGDRSPTLGLSVAEARELWQELGKVVGQHEVSL